MDGQVIRAHYDGRVIVPDEPVTLPVNQPLHIQATPATPPETNGVAVDPRVVEERLAKLRTLIGRLQHGGIPDEALRREDLYSDDRA